MERIDVQTAPDRYRHWRLTFDGPIANLIMDVDDVESSGAQLLVQRGHAIRGDGEVGDRAVGLEANRAAQSDQIIGRRQGLRAGAAMQDLGVKVRGVIGREHADVVTILDEALREGLDMPRDTPRIRPRVRRQDRYSHADKW